VIFNALIIVALIPLALRGVRYRAMNAEALLLIVGLGMGLAVLTSVIPAWYVARIKPAEVLRRG